MYTVSDHSGGLSRRTRAIWRLIVVLSLFATPTSDLRAGEEAFTKNMGQWPDSILFRTETSNSVVWVVRDGLYFEFVAEPLPARTSFRKRNNADDLEPETDFLLKPVALNMGKMSVPSTTGSLSITAQEETATRQHFFIGRDKSKWRTEVPSYRKLLLEKPSGRGETVLQVLDARLRLNWKTDL